MNKLFNSQFYIIKDLTKKAFRNILAFMKGYYCGMPIRVAHKDMAAFLTNFLKSETFQDTDKLSGLYWTEFCHTATSISCSPTNSGTETLPFSTSRQSWITSLIRERRAERVLACVWQPFKEGTDAIRMPSSSFSMTTVKRYFDIDFLSPLFGSITYWQAGVKWFTGLIDDVRIYPSASLGTGNYARTAEQILQDYNAGAAARLGD